MYSTQTPGQWDRRILAPILGFSFSIVFLVALCLPYHTAALNWNPFGQPPGADAAASGNFSSLGQALNLEGTDDKLINQSIFYYTGPSAFTLEFWVKPNAVTDYSQFLGANTGWGAFLFHASNDGTIYVGTDVANRIITASGVMVNGVWQHFAFTFESGTGKLYKNGNLINSKSMSAPNHWGGLRLGNGDLFNGSIDEFRVWDIARSQADIQANRNNELCPQTGLLAYYPFNQGAAGGNNAGLTTVIDGSGNSNSGVLENLALTGNTSNWIAPGSGVGPALASPTAFTVTGGGTYACASGGLVVGLSSSQVNVNYQLKKNGIDIGSPVAGTGSALSFGIQPAGTYTVLASYTTYCTNFMTGSAEIIASGCPGEALNLEGVGDNLLNFSVFNSSAPTAFTVELWVKPTSVSNYSQLLGAWWGWGAFIFHASYDGTIYTGTNAAEAITTAPGTMVIGVWQHYAFTYENGTGKLYRNGVLLHTKSMIAPNAWGGFRMGNGSVFDGDADEVRIWNVARTESEIQANMHTEICPQTGLVAYYPFNQGIGGGNNTGITTVTDASGNGNSASLENVGLTGSTSNWVFPGSGIAAVLPSVFAVTGGGTFACGVSGAAVGLSGSEVNATYQLQRNGVNVGLPVAGTGAALSFGNQTGGTYTVTAAIASTCIRPMTGNAVITTPMGCPGQALNLEGVGDNLLNFTVFNSSAPTAFTVELWVKPSSVSNFSQFLGAWWGWGSFLFTGSYDGTIYTGTNGGDPITTAPGTMVIGVWQHYAFTYENGTGKLYKNGVLLHTKSMVAPNAWGGFRMGNGSVFDGDADEVRIWNVARTESEIQAEMNREICPHANLVAYYDFNQGIGGGNNTGLTLVNDASGNNRTAYLENVALTGSTSNWVAPGSGVSLAYGLPAAFTINKVGLYDCTDGGIELALSGSESGMQYQLKRDGSNVGSPVAGTGTGISFGNQAASGTYTVLATNTTLGCTKVMTGAAIVDVTLEGRVYVSPTGTGDGSSWATATNDLQAAIDNPCAGEIWVAAGSYKPNAYPTGCTDCTTNRDFAFMLKDGIKIYGGFEGTEKKLSERTPGHETILSADIDNNGIWDTTNTYHVVISINDNNVVLDGLTIERSYPTISGSHTIEGEVLSNSDGGVCFIKANAFTINNVKFFENYAVKNGGAIYTSGASGINSITNCQFINNYSDARGGAIYSTSSGINGGYTRIDNCQFDNNFALRDGGAIYSYYVYGNDMITNCQFTGNISEREGGAIYLYYSGYNEVNFTTIEECQFTGNSSKYGGALLANYSYGNDIIRKCNFENNSSTLDGGAVYLYYNSYNDINYTTIEDCQFIGNISEREGGALYEYSGDGHKVIRSTFIGNEAKTGGAIGLYSYNFFLADCLFAKNKATSSASGAGGAISAEADLSVRNCTFADNIATLQPGAAIYNIDDLTLTNCVFWGNVQQGAGTTAQQQVYNNGYTCSISNSLIQDVLPTGATDGGGNIYLDPLFTDAASNDYTLQGSSPAINAGNNAGVSATDLSGNIRIQGCTVDMGAYEYKKIMYVTPTGTGNGSSWANATSNLQAAIDDACGVSEVWVAAGTYKPAAYPTGGCPGCNSTRDYAFMLKDGVKVYGGFAGTETELSQRTSGNETILSGDIDNNDILDNQNTYHVVLSLQDSDKTLLDGCTVTGGNANGPAFVTIAGILVYRNYGALVVRYSNTLFTNNKFINNRGVDGGGAIVDFGTTNFKNCRFEQNFSIDGYGIGLEVFRSEVSIDSCHFENNHDVSAYGGGCYIDDSNGKITNTTFLNNSAVYGGGLCLAEYNTSFLVENCVFEGNGHADSDGGGLYNQAEACIIKNCTFLNNVAANGGALYEVSYYATIIENCTFTDNTADGYGGALYMDYPAYYTGPSCIVRSKFTGNKATAEESQGGAIYSTSGNYSEDGLIFQQCTFMDNEAGYGGAICTYDYELALENCLFANNHAIGEGTSSGGGAIYHGAESLNVTHSTFVENTSEGLPGGGIIAGDGDFTVVNSIFWGNTSINGTLQQAQLWVDGNSTVSNCLIQDGLPQDATDGGGNIYTDPLFLDPTDIDGDDDILATADDGLSLQGGSPAINAGTTVGSVPNDILGENRDSNPDMGAYETSCINPAAQTLTGGGTYCSGGSGVEIGLSGSQIGVSYQLQIDGNDLGDPVVGTGSAISFGNQTEEGEYTVNAYTGSGGCTAPMTASVEITLEPSITPSVEVEVTSPGTTICAGTSVSFEATPTNGGTTPIYQWKKNGTNIGGAMGATYSSATLANGDVITCVLTSNVACPSSPTVESEEIAMTVRAKPVINDTIVIQPTCTVYTGSIEIIATGDGALEYTLTPGITNSWQTSPLFPNLTARVYRPAVRLASDPTCELLTPTNPISIWNVTALTATTSSTPAKCFGTPTGRGLVTASGGVRPYTYLWSNGSTVRNPTNLPPGTNTITVTDALGCTVVKSVVVGQATQIIFTVTRTGTGPFTTTIAASGGTGPYKYSVVDVVGFQNSNQIVLDTAGRYIFSVRDSKGCVQSRRMLISATSPMLLDETELGDANFERDEITSAPAIALYPNPSTGRVLLELLGTNSADNNILVVTNALGQTVLQQKLYTYAGEATELDLSGLMSGIYNVSVILPSGQKLTERLVIAR